MNPPMITVLNFIASSKGCSTKSIIESVEATWPVLKGWLTVQTLWTGEERVTLKATAGFSETDQDEGYPQWRNHPAESVGVMA
jgi:hypothetical protein